MESVSISKPRLSNRQSRLVVWELFAGIQILCAIGAIRAVGVEGGLTLAVMEIGLTGGIITFWLREPAREEADQRPARAAAGPKGPPAGPARTRMIRPSLALLVGSLVGFPASVWLSLELGAALGWEGGDRLLVVMVVAPLIWAGACFAALLCVSSGRSGRGARHV